MAETPRDTPDETAPFAAPETTTFLLATLTECYRQELAAEEDVHRSLPFFGTALGLVIGALAYAAGRLPKWTPLDDWPPTTAFIVSATFLGLAVVEAAIVLFWLFRAITWHEYQRIDPKGFILRFGELRGFYDKQGIARDRQDGPMAADMRQMAIDSYLTVAVGNRELNVKRYRMRALAARHLVLSLICALCATTVILIADKVGFLPKVIP